MNYNQHMYDNTSRTAEQNLTKLVSECSLHGGKSEEWKMAFVTKNMIMGFEEPDQIWTEPFWKMIQFWPSKTDVIHSI